MGHFIMKDSDSANLEKHPEYGFLQYKPTPTPEQITEFYANEFYSGDYKNFNDSSLEVQMEDREFFEREWADISDHITGVLNKPLSDLSLLDVGCGWSQALLFFVKKGIDCYGFDPAPEAVEYGVSKGLNVKLAGMDNMDVFESKKFDVVLIKNVLEHLANPVEILEEIHEKVLNKGGMIIIDVPNEFNVFQTAGRDLHQLNDWWVAPPAHLNYFSKDSLVNLLEGTGYNVKLSEASFPLEMFLLFGDCYVGDDKVGKQCHQKRVAFETNLRKLGHTKALHQFYQALAELNLGRQVTVYAVSK
jgi:2-polyprenyl-3-methyl-5-hydroxy-6-metoxy-1,4-benzoquinol methylase